MSTNDQIPVPVPPGAVFADCDGEGHIRFYSIIETSKGTGPPVPKPATAKAPVRRMLPKAPVLSAGEQSFVDALWLMRKAGKKLGEALVAGVESGSSAAYTRGQLQKVVGGASAYTVERCVADLIAAGCQFDTTGHGHDKFQCTKIGTVAEAAAVLADRMEAKNGPKRLDEIPSGPPVDATVSPSWPTVLADPEAVPSALRGTR